MEEIVTANQNHLWFLLHWIVDAIVKCEDNVLAKVNISPQKYRVLTTIKFFKDVVGEELIINHLGPLLNRSTNSISTIIDRMEKEGLIKKTRDSSDRRINRVVMTQKAEERLRMAARPDMELIGKLLSVFNEEEIQILILLMNRLKIRLDDELGRKETKADMEFGNKEKMTEFLNNICS